MRSFIWRIVLYKPVLTTSLVTMLNYLQILAIGKKDGNRKYQYEIGNFTKEYPESELIPYANSLLQASEEFQQNRYNSARAKIH